MSQFDESLSIKERIDRFRFACMGWYDEKVSGYRRLKENFFGWLTFQTQRIAEDRPRFRDRLAATARRFASFSKGLNFGFRSFLLRIGSLASEMKEHSVQGFHWLRDIPEKRRVRAELAKELQTAIKQLEREDFILAPSNEAAPQYTLAEIAPRVVFHYAKLAMAVVMVGAVSVLIYFVANPSDSRIVSNAVAGVNTASISNVSAFRHSVEDEELDPGDSEMISIAKARENIELLEDFEATGSVLSDTEKGELNDLLIKNLSIVVRQYIAQGLDCEGEKKELLKLCHQHASESDDVRSKSNAEFWLFAIDAIQFANVPSEEGYQTFVNSYSLFPDVCRANPEQAEKMAYLLKSMSKKFRKNELTKKAIAFYSDAIDDSESPEILEIAANMRDLSIFVELDIETLCERVSWGGPAATDDMKVAIDLLTTNPTSTTNTWETIIHANESFLSYSRFERFNGVRELLAAAVSDLPDSEKKVKLKACLARQQQRIEIVGKQIESLGTSLANEQPISPKSESYKLIVFANEEARSSEDIEKLKRTAKFAPKLHSVLAYTNADDLGSDESLGNLKNISIASRKTSSELFNLIPIDSYPYTLLLDESNRIVAVNVAVGEVESRVAKLQKKSRDGEKSKMRVSSVVKQ